MTSKTPIPPKEVMTLLGKLKETSGIYPPELLEARRAQYLKQVEALNIDLPSLNGNAVSALRSGVASTLEKVLQIALGVMVAGVVISAAVIYREEIVDFFTTEGGNVAPSIVAPLPDAATPTLEPSLVPSDTPLSYQSLARTPTATATATSSMPTKGIKEGKKNPGLHLGQTPTPPSTRKTPKP